MLEFFPPCTQFSFHFAALATQQQEIDYVEEKDGRFSAFEFKWSPRKLARIPKTFRMAYPDYSFETVSPENYLQFLK